MAATELITMSFVATPEQKSWLEHLAAQDDRSVSYVLRQILDHEIQRRSIPSLESVFGPREQGQGKGK